MGKVQSTFMNMFPGQLSRESTGVIISLKNQGSYPIKPGQAVFLSADGKGVTLTQQDSVFARFVGIAARSASATPDTYRVGNMYSDPYVHEYAVDDPVDIVVEGCVVVELENEMADPGGAVHLKLEDGTFTTEAVANETIQLTNCSWRRSADLSDGCAEIVIKSRNIL